MIGLALGTGGARGCAHIGVIRGLETMGLRPMGVAGGSIGALVGALYALGIPPDELASLRLGARIRSAIHPRISRAGLLDPAPPTDMVRALIAEKTFGDTAIPLAVTAVDLAADERVVLREGPIAPAVTASLMVPGIFPPYEVAGRWLNDPGVIDPVPIDVAGAFEVDVVLGVSADLERASRGRLEPSQPPISWLFGHAGNLCRRVGNLTDLPWAKHLGCTFQRMSRGAARYDAPTRVIWIEPAFGRMNANQFGACERAITLGEEAVRRGAPRIRAVLQGRN